jgi:hypothetical protein
VDGSGSLLGSKTTGLGISKSSQKFSLSSGYFVKISKVCGSNLGSLNIWKF